MNETVPLVSIVVPTLNSESRLRQCLDSLVTQDYEKDKTEILVVDGGSRDNTLHIACEYPVRIVTELRKGRGAAYNKGFLESKGEYVAYLDSDAVAPSNWLKESLRIMKTDSSVAALHCRNLAPSDASFFQKCVDTLNSKSLGQANGAIYKRISLEKVGGFNESLQYLQEDELKSRLRRNGYLVKNTGRPLVWHYPRKNLRSYFGQCVENAVGSLRLLVIQKQFRLLGKLSARILTAILPFSVVAPLVLHHPLTWIPVSFLPLGIVVYSAYLWHSTDEKYRSLKYVLPATFLMWVSTLADIAGYFHSLIRH